MQLGNADNNNVNSNNNNRRLHAAGHENSMWCVRQFRINRLLASSFRELAVAVAQHISFVFQEPVCKSVTSTLPVATECGLHPNGRIPVNNHGPPVCHWPTGRHGRSFPLSVYDRTERGEWCPASRGKASHQKQMVHELPPKTSWTRETGSKPILDGSHKCFTAKEAVSSRSLS